MTRQTDGKHRPQDPRTTAQATVPTAVPTAVQATVPTTGGRVARHFVALFTGAAAVRVIALASQVVLARLLGPESMGALGVAQALLVFSGVFTDGGLTTLSLREMVRSPERRARIATATMVVQLVLASVGAVAMAVVALAAPWDHRTTLVVLSFCPALICSALNMAYILKSAEMMGTVALSRVVATALPSVLSVVLVIATHAPLWVGVSTCIGLFINDFLIFVVLRRRIGFGFVRVTSAEVRASARSGVPMILTQACLIIPTVAGTITVYVINGAHDAGLFQAAWQLSFAALTVAALVIDAIYPELVRRATSGLDTFARFVNTALQLAVRITFPAAVGASFAATPLIHLLFGSKYAASDDVLRIAVWVAPSGFCWVILGHALIARDAERVMTRLSFVVTGVTVVSVPLMAWQYGPAGAAAALVGASVLQAVLYASAVQLRPVGALKTLAQEAPYALLPAVFCVGAVELGWTGIIPTMVAAGLGVTAWEALRGLPTLKALRNVRARTTEGSST